MKKKFITKIYLMIISFVLFTPKVFAAVSCDGIFGDTEDPNNVAYYLNWIFNIIKFAGPILVLIVTIKDLLILTADLKQDPNEMNKLIKKTLKRIMYAVLLFILPTLVDTLFKTFGLYGTCGIGIK